LFQASLTYFVSVGFCLPPSGF